MVCPTSRACRDLGGLHKMKEDLARQALPAIGEPQPLPPGRRDDAVLAPPHAQPQVVEVAGDLALPHYPLLLDGRLVLVQQAALAVVEHRPLGR